MNDEIDQHEDHQTGITELNDQEPLVEEVAPVTPSQTPITQPQPTSQDVTPQADQGHTITQVSNSRFEVTIAGHTFSIKREGGTYLWGSHFASSLEHLIEKLKSRM